MKTVDVLISAKKLIEADDNMITRDNNGGFHSGRTRGTVFRDKYGNRTLLLAEATCFCSIGAVVAAVGADAEGSSSGIFKIPPTPRADTDELGRRAVRPAQRKAYLNAVMYLDAAADKLERFYGATSINDYLDHKTVMSMFDAAIRNAKRRHITGDRKKTQAVTL